MDQFIHELAKRIKVADKKLIIGVSSHGAAGKITFTNRLIDREARNHATIDYTYQNVDHRYKMTACHPSAHHLPSLERDVQMVREGLDFCTIDTHYMKKT